MSFQDLLIADFREGQRLDKESWLTPNNAFKNLENVFLRRGIIQKRYGYSVLSRVGTSYLEASAALGSSNYTALNLPVLAGSVYIRDTVEYFTDDGAGVLTGSAGGSGTIVYATGVMNVTFNAGPTGTPTVAYQTGISYTETIGASGSTVYSYTALNIPVSIGSSSITDTVETFTDDGLGKLTGGAGGKGTIVYSTGVINVTFNATTGTAPTVSYKKLEANTDLTIRGIFNLENSLTSDRGIVMDRQKLLEYNSITKVFDTKPVSITYVEPLGAKGTTAYNYTLSELTVVASSVSITDKVETFTSDGAGNLTGSAGGTGNVNYTTGLITVTFNTSTTSTPLVTYDKVVTSFYTYFGGADQLINGIELFEKLYFTDGLDVSLSSGIWKYDPTAGNLGEVSKFKPLLSEVATDLVTKALIIKSYYRQLVLFNTIEGPSATNHRQRVRWSKVDAGNNIATDWLANIPGGGSSLDAATNETIVSAGMVKGVMVVAFERSIWVLDYTGNKDVPFRWRHLEGQLHIGSTFATVEAENMVIFIGEGGIYGCDGIRVEELSKKIPDFTLEDVEINQFAKCSAVYDERLNQILLSYPATSTDTGENTRMKVIGIDEGWFTDYDYGMRSTGLYINDSETTWNDVITEHGDSWEEIIGTTFAEITKQSKETIVLGGSTDGYVYILNNTSAVVDSPDGVATKFNFVIEGKDYSPFVEEGQQTTLGYIDIFNSSVTSSSYTVYLKMNDQDGSYKDQNISLTGNNKIWKRVLARQTGNSHSFKITLDSTQMTSDSAYTNLKFHAFKLGVRPDGGVRLT